MTQNCLSLAKAGVSLGITLNVDTVLTMINQDENLTSSIAQMSRTRWNILQAMPVPGAKSLLHQRIDSKS
jgi:hypothetical protein